jgi:hypothetical protein
MARLLAAQTLAAVAGRPLLNLINTRRGDPRPDPYPVKIATDATLDRIPNVYVV